VMSGVSRDPLVKVWFKILLTNPSVFLILYFVLYL
jgi:hypothetical protein